MKDENSEAEEGRVCSRKSQSSDLSIGSDAKQHLERVLGPQALVICVHLTTHACKDTVRMTQQRSKASPFPSVIQAENVSLNLIVTGLSSELGFRDHSTLNFLKAQSVSSFLSPPLCQAYICAQSQFHPCDPMDCSIPDSSVHGIFQPRILEQVAIPFSMTSS